MLGASICSRGATGPAIESADHRYEYRRRLLQVLILQWRDGDRPYNFPAGQVADIYSHCAVHEFAADLVVALRLQVTEHGDRRRHELGTEVSPMSCVAHDKAAFARIDRVEL